MLASRASTVRNVQRIARSFATVVETTGVKVAAVDYNQPTSSVTVLVKAGSRFEPKQGVANALKNFAFKVCHDSDIGIDLILKWKKLEYCQKIGHWNRS
jgi:predicted Zn-dependent peptidase